MECLQEIDIKQGDQLNNDVKTLLDRSVLFLEYENTFYYRDVDFLKVG
jgi:hypothetical protein